MFNENELKNIIIDFKIPFAFDVKNCIERESSGEPYLVIIEDIPALIKTQRFYNEDATISGIKLAPFARMEKDRYGILSYTHVQIWFDSQTFGSIDKNIILNDDNYFFLLAIKYLNKFIADYKRVTREYWIHQIIPSDIIGYRYVLRDRNGETIITSVPIKQTIQFNGGEEYCLEESKDDELRTYISNEISSLVDDLYMAIYDNFDRGFYNIALIQCAILFENFVYSNLKNKLSKTKLDKIKKKEGCGCLIGIYEVCNRGLKEYFSIDFGLSDEFKNFHLNVLKIRNDLVHGERLTQINKEECNNAINCTEKAITYLSNEFKDIDNVNKK